MKLPDVLAMKLDDALNQYHDYDAGLEIKIKFTRAPGNKSQSRLRVLRIQEAINGSIVLTVAPELTQSH